MIEHLTVVKLFALTVATVVATLLLVGSVVFFEPPAFFGFAFGFLNGASWIGLLNLYLRYWEEFA